MPSPTSDPIRSLYADRAEASDERVGSLVQYDSGEYLYSLARKAEAHRTLEVGLAFGGSALFLCRALAENGGGTHTAIDPHQTRRYEGAGIANVEAAGFGESFRCIEAKSYMALPEILDAEGPGSYDLIFIDGNHTFDYTLVDFFYADQLVRVGGYVVFDDLWMRSARRAVRFVLRNRDYVLESASGRGLPIARRAARAARRLATRPRTLWHHPLNVGALRKRADDQRKWDFHRSF